MKTWKICVPASTANAGPGFDSIGLALNLYLELLAEPSDEWEFVPVSSRVASIPTGKDNLMYQTALQLARQHGCSELPPYRVEVRSNIPLARGLGSSATALVAGIELADVLLELKLTKHEKLAFAAEMEGHPDNVAPSILGGCVVGVYDGELYYTEVPVTGVKFLAVIPPFELTTKNARSVLPEALSYGDSVAASGVANVAVAALLQQNWELFGSMMKRDRFHQPYRLPLIPHYQKVERFIENEVYGTFLSGAGPTMIALLDTEGAEEKCRRFEAAFPELEWRLLDVETRGSTAEEAAVKKA